jgi:hypothetical protein
MADLVNQKTGKKYKILGFDRDAGTITLSGELGVTFTEKYNKELFKKLGYELVAA